MNYSLRPPGKFSSQGTSQLSLITFSPFGISPATGRAACLPKREHREAKHSLTLLCHRTLRTRLETNPDPSPRPLEPQTSRDQARHDTPTFRSQLLECFRCDWWAEEPSKKAETTDMNVMHPGQHTWYMVYI